MTFSNRRGTFFYLIYLTHGTDLGFRLGQASFSYFG